MKNRYIFFGYFKYLYSFFPSIFQNNSSSTLFVFSPFQDMDHIESESISVEILTQSDFSLAEQIWMIK